MAPVALFGPSRFFFYFISFRFISLFLSSLSTTFITGIHSERKREREKEMLEEPQRTRATATTTKRQRQETAQTQSDD